MSLPLHESRVLALIEMDLRRADPDLAERFAMFNRLAERPSAPDPGRRVCWAVTVAVLAVVVVLGLVAVAVSG